MSLFSPATGTLGGSLIGLSASVLLLGNGDILGCSGIISSIFVKPKETLGDSKGKWKILFTTAFLIASRAISKWGVSKESLLAEQRMMADSKALPIVSTLGFCVAGFLVGFGTRLGNGCTSGHGICGLARFSKRSLAAVVTFMSTGIFAATMCSPICKFAKYIRTGPEGIEEFYPNDTSKFYSAILIAVFAGMTLPLLRLITKSVKDKTANTSKNEDRKGPIAAISAFLFSAGLNLSGMTKNYKIYGFLDLKGINNGTWDATLMCVMGGGLLVSAAGYQFVKGQNIIKNDKALDTPLLQDKSEGGKFNVPTSQKIDRKLIIGNAMFGIGWGMAGLCPGPALFLAANGYPQVLFHWWPCNIVGAILGEKAKSII